MLYQSSLVPRVHESLASPCFITCSLYSRSPTPQKNRNLTFPSPYHVANIRPSSEYLAVCVQVVSIGVNANIPMVARVAITDYQGNVVLDTFVRPTQPVTDYRYQETGLQPAYLASAPYFHTVQQRVMSLIQEKILIGYALWQFFSVLGIAHPALDTRDVAIFLPFRRSLRCRQILPLPILVNRLMGRNIGLGYEHPVENARAALDLFRTCEELWEGIIDSGSWPCTLPPAAYASCFI